MSFSKAFLEELKARFRPSELIGRYVKLTRAGREYRGLSPFTNEKTPSFFVNDEKGFYHCFSSGESGDIITFLEKAQKLSFIEAVKMLAEEAGMELPRQSEEDRRRETRQASLLEVMAMAAAFYQHELTRRSGAPARNYLAERGLRPETIERFRLGCAPARRPGLYEYLLQKDVPPELMIEAGLVIRSEKGRQPYDRFRDRIMFPIEDARGRVIAFGGRALQSAQKAKYLNSPETPLFHKGRVLYNLKGAREASHREGGTLAGTVIVTEGYMDVIALHQAGFHGAVAPLGTALSEAQIQLLWRLTPEPVLCFDGDRAGLAAAHRVIERALPLLKAGHSLRFALLPEGQDPDDVIQAGGEAVMRDVLNTALPLADMIWDREISMAPWATPEQRAGLEQRLRALAASIRDSRVRQYYQSDFKHRLAVLFEADHRPASWPDRRPAARSQPPAPAPRRREGPPAAFISPELKRSPLAKNPQAGAQHRESLIVLTVLNHPELLENYCETFAGVEFSNPGLDKLRNEIISIAALGQPLDREALGHHLSGTKAAHMAAALQQQKALKNDAFALASASLEEAERGWVHLLERQRSVDILRQELRDAEQALAREMTDENMARLVAVKAQLHESESGDLG